MEMRHFSNWCWTPRRRVQAPSEDKQDGRKVNWVFVQWEASRGRPQLRFQKCLATFYYLAKMPGNKILEYVLDSPINFPN